jgi:hypothetical protein
MKVARLGVAALFCLMLFASPAFAASPQGPSDNNRHSQQLSLNLEGLITNAGDQRYDFGGGQLLQGSLNGNALPIGQVSFSFSTTVHGLNANGRGSLGTSSSHGNDGNDKNDWKHANKGFSIQFTINGAVPAAIFPLTPVSPGTFANCDPTAQQCSSEIPLLFTGFATVQSANNGDPLSIPIAVESPYWSPFGGPILITSFDTPPTIALVVTYSRATIMWSGVQLAGGIAGTFGTKPVTGSYNQLTFSQEDLVAGTESDAGSIGFTGMSDPTLNARGAFAGHTTFSLTGSFDCAAMFGVPDLPCTATGAMSDGSFGMIGQGATITGTYHTVWSVPSLFTQTTVMGAAIQH